MFILLLFIIKELLGRVDSFQPLLVLNHERTHRAKTIGRYNEYNYYNIHCRVSIIF